MPVNFNPGSSGKQRRLAFEPIAGMRVIEDMFAPAVKSGKVTILKPAKVVGVDKDKSSISDVMVEDLQTGKKTKNICYYGYRCHGAGRPASAGRYSVQNRGGILCRNA